MTVFRRTATIFVFFAGGRCHTLSLSSARFCYGQLHHDDAGRRLAAESAGVRYGRGAPPRRRPSRLVALIVLQLLSLCVFVAQRAIAVAHGPVVMTQAAAPGIGAVAALIAGAALFGAPPSSAPLDEAQAQPATSGYVLKGILATAAEGSGGSHHRQPRRPFWPLCLRGTPWHQASSCNEWPLTTCYWPPARAWNG